MHQWGVSWCNSLSENERHMHQLVPSLLFVWLSHSLLCETMQMRDKRGRSFLLFILLLADDADFLDPDVLFPCVCVSKTPNTRTHATSRQWWRRRRAKFWFKKREKRRKDIKKGEKSVRENPPEKSSALSLTLLVSTVSLSVCIACGSGLCCLCFSACCVCVFGWHTFTDFQSCDPLRQISSRQKDFLSVCVKVH